MVLSGLTQSLTNLRLPPPIDLEQYSCTSSGSMEEWDYVDDHQLQGWKGREICITCQHFTYGIDQHCRTLVACNLRRGLLQQGEHLLKRCEHWAWVSAEAPPAK